MDVYKGHGEGDTKGKWCAWKLLLFKFNIVLYDKFTIHLFIWKHTQNTSCTLFLFIANIPLDIIRVTSKAEMIN